MPSIGLGGASVVATNVELVGRHSAQQSGRLIIDFTTVAPRLMKWPLSAWKASTSPPSLESSGLPGIRCIAGWKGQPYGWRTICQARWKERLEDHIELFRCYYNFIRPHSALKFGREIRTPAMQAGWPHLWDQASLLRLVFAVLFRVSERWGNRQFNQFEEKKLRQLKEQMLGERQLKEQMLGEQILKVKV